MKLRRWPVLVAATAVAFVPSACTSTKGTPAASTVPKSQPLISTTATSAAATTPASYPVASTTEVFTDDSRSTPASGGYPAKTHRTIPTLLFYPEQAGGQQRAFPLIVFSHGFDRTATAYATTLRSWATHGYVVAAPEFPLTTTGAPGGLDLLDFVSQPGDVSFVITQMLQLDQTDIAPMYHQIDIHRIAVAGHSLGAVTTLGVADNSCCHDARVDAAVEIDGEEKLPGGLGAFPGTYFTGHAPPLLVVHGSADQTAPYSFGQAIYADAPVPKYFLTLLGAPHEGFATSPWDAAFDRTLLAFLDYYLGTGHSIAQIQTAGTDKGVATIQADAP